MINHMDGHNGRVLLIENDSQISRIIVEQSLAPHGFQVDLFESSAAVIQELASIFENRAPDVIIIDLNIPGLSCKDLMVALASCGVNVPIVVIANKGQEDEILQTFRLGAVDFLFCPIRETEVIAVFENALSKHHAQGELDIYAKKLDQTTASIERQLKDFSEIFSFIKQAWNINEFRLVSDKISSLAIQLTEADCAWVLSLEANQSGFILRACHNVPEAMQSQLDLPYDDELTAVTTLSGQALSVHGEALKRFTGLEWIGAVLTVPVIQNGKVCAHITTARYLPQPFTTNQQAMLELAAEYAWILIENSQRIHQMEQSQVFLKQANIHATLESKLKFDLLRQATLELRSPLKSLMENVDALLDDSEHKLSREQTTTLNDIQEEAEILMDISDSMLISRQDESQRTLDDLDLNLAVRSVVNRYWPIAQMGRVMINLELPSMPSLIKVYPAQITKVIEGLLSNALKYSPTNGEVIIRINQDEHNTSMMVIDQGEGIEENLADRVFESSSGIIGYRARRFGGIGISLPVIKEIIQAYKGQIWIDKLQDTGFTIAFSLPRG